MEQLTPVSVIESEVTAEATDETSVSMHPLARGIIKAAVGIATDFSREVISRELERQHVTRIRSRHNQEELLTALEVAMLQTELDILDAQNPSRVFHRIFDGEHQTKDDAQTLAAVRAELEQIATAQPAPVFLEPREFVVQASAGVNSAA